MLPGLRDGELRDRIEGTSEKMLSPTLRTLVRDGPLWRRVEPSVPPKVSYGLTPPGTGTAQRVGGTFDRIRNSAVEILSTRAAYD